MNTPPCDEPSHPATQQQQQLDSVDVSVAESLAHARESSLLQFYYSSVTMIYV